MFKKKALIIYLLSLLLLPSLVLAGNYIDIFDNDEEVWVWDYASDRYGQPWVNATCNLTVFNQDQQTVNISVIMTNQGNGIFNQSIGTFPEIGYYPMELRCYEIDGGTGTEISGPSDRIGFYITDELTDDESKAMTATVVILIILSFIFGYISMHLSQENLPLKILYLFVCFMFAGASIVVANRYVTTKGYMDISSILTGSYWLVGVIMALSLGLIALLLFFKLLHKTSDLPGEF